MHRDNLGHRCSAMGLVKLHLTVPTPESEAGLGRASNLMPPYDTVGCQLQRHCLPPFFVFQSHQHRTNDHERCTHRLSPVCLLLPYWLLGLEQLTNRSVLLSAVFFEGVHCLYKYSSSELCRYFVQTSFIRLVCGIEKRHLTRWRGLPSAAVLNRPTWSA